MIYIGIDVAVDTHNCFITNLDNCYSQMKKRDLRY